MTSNGDLLGVVLLIRHGDRRGFYQDPDSYTASDTSLTALGAIEEQETGTLLKARYLDASSSTYIQNATTDAWDPDQFYIRADSADEGAVIWDSAAALASGLWNETMTVQVANGSSVSYPRSLVQIESVLEDDITLEGWLDCAPFTTSTDAFYNSSEFTAKAKEAAPFLTALPPYLDGRSVGLKNMWNIFDYMNVQNTYNSTFKNNLPPTFLAQARDLANWHEYGVFSDPSLDGIGNIAGRTILPTITTALTRIANGSDPLKLYIEEISYKPFLSLFNMTQVTVGHPELAGIVNYAAVTAFEVRSGSGSGPVVNFLLKNGTDVGFTQYDMFGEADVPLQSFVDKLSPAAINSTAEWCTLCSNTQDRGCAALAEASASALASAHHHGSLTNAEAGVIGAFVSLAVAALALVLMVFLGMVSVGKPASRKRASGNAVGEAAHGGRSDGGSDAISLNSARKH